MNKRKLGSFALCAMLFALCASAEAQQPTKVPRIGFWLSPRRSFFPARVEAFRQGLRDLGYIEGKNIVMEYRSAEGKLESAPRLVRRTRASQGGRACQQLERIRPQRMLPKRSPLSSLQFRIQLRAG